MDPELQALLDEQMKTFEQFKASNDAFQKQVKDLGSADAVIDAEVKKIGATLDEIGKKVIDFGKRADQIEIRLNRPGALGGGHDGAEQQKAIEGFNLTCRLAAQLKGRVAPASLDPEGYLAYKSSFREYLRRGDGQFGDAERKAMSVGSDPDGGYLVTPDTTGRMAKKIFETSEVRPIAAVQAISTDALEGVNDLAEAGAGWVGETQARPATTTPTVGKWRIPVHEMYAMPEATQQLLDDAMVDVEAWLGDKVADKLVRLENAAFVTGDGVAKPRGFATYPTAATADATRPWGTIEHVATGASGSYGAGPNGSDKLIDLVYRLKSAYRAQARWAMSRATVGETRKLKDADGNYVWLPSMLAGQPATLLGYAIAEMEDLPAIAPSSLSVWFGAFPVAYQIVDRQGTRVLRDPYTNKPYVRFYTTRRVGGDVLNFEAIKTLKFI